MEDIRTFLYEFSGQEIDGYVLTDVERERFLAHTVYVYPLEKEFKQLEVSNKAILPSGDIAKNILVDAVEFDGTLYLYNAKVVYPKPLRGTLGYKNKVALAKDMKIEIYPYLKKGIVSLKQLTQYLHKYPELLIRQETVGYITDECILVRR